MEALISVGSGCNLGAQRAKIHRALSPHLPLIGLGIIGNRLYAIKIFERYQGPFGGDASTDQSGARRGDGDIDFVFSHVFENGSELGLVHRKKQVVKRLRRQF
jgi:hypothetical protein